MGEVFGGPAGYGSGSAATRMLDHHRGAGDHARAAVRFAALMSRAADDAGLPDDPEFRAAFVGYAEWGTRLALQNSQPGAALAERRRCLAGAGASPRPTSRRAIFLRSPR